MRRWVPVRHLAAALLVAYNPHTCGAGLDLVVVAAWGHPDVSGHFSVDVYWSLDASE